jgi:hypothetical protein
MGLLIKKAAFRKANANQKDRQTKTTGIIKAEV